MDLYSIIVQGAAEVFVPPFNKLIYFLKARIVYLRQIAKLAVIQLKVRYREFRSKSNSTLRPKQMIFKRSRKSCNNSKNGKQIARRNKHNNKRLKLESQYNSIHHQLRRILPSQKYKTVARKSGIIKKNKAQFQLMTNSPNKVSNKASP